MLDFMKELDADYDALFFMPHDDSNDKVEIHARKFVSPGEPVEGSSVGPSWHIVLFKLNEDGTAKDVDTFDAILSEPKEYVSELIPLNFYGVVARKTTTSKVFLEDFVAKISTV